MNLKNKLREKQLTIGSWITMSDPAIAEIMSKVGFDWLVVDMEHSGLSTHHAQELIRTIDLCGVVPLVRATENDPALLKRYMDMGAHGVLVPFVNSKADAEKAVAAIKYPPLGTRGVGLARAQNYSLDLESYRKWNQENSIVIAQLEHIKAVENLESIMGVDGIDGFIIGPYDLSGSLGVPGEFEDSRVKAALVEIKKKSERNGYLMGQHVVNPDPQEALSRIKDGIKFVAFGTDFLFLSGSCRDRLDKIKKEL